MLAVVCWLLIDASYVCASNVALSTPGNFQVLSLSPNGKWACGVFVDAASNTYPFRWNLESGSIDILGAEPGTAWDVANDGTVSGDYPDTEVQENHASVIMPCYWRGMKRYGVELPKGNLTDGIGCGISPDGRFVSGAICNGGIYTPYLWEEGKLSRSLSTGSHAIPYCVSPDGQSAAGYATKYNRVACYWPSDGGIVYFEDSPSHSTGPWNYARNFSPDGKKLLYWGGWELAEDNSTLYLYSVYDIATGERRKVVAPSIDSTVEFFDISNNELLVGAAEGRGYVHVANQGGMFIDDYLAQRGVNLSAICDDMYAGDDYYVGQLPVFVVIAVSEDENVFVMQYYNKNGETCSMALKIDQDFTNVAPAEVKVEQMSGLHNVALSWKRPVGANNLRGFNVYRDGKKLNLLPLNQLYYYDTQLANGDYTYEVSAVTTAGIETKADGVSVSVADVAKAEPYSLFARQKGVNAGYLTWKAPLSDLVHKRYYDLETSDYSGFAVYEDVDMEAAISFSKEEMLNYSGYSVAEVSFVPMGAHTAWSVNLYTHAADGTLELLHSEPVSQTLVYGTLNTVKLSAPVTLPQGDLIVAVAASAKADIGQVVGTQNGVTVPGRSDLLRQKSDGDFISAYESSLASGYTVSCLSWAIDLGLYSGAVEERVKSKEESGSEAVSVRYNITLGGETIGQTDGTSFEIPSLADGTYTVGVEAEYSDGAVSKRQSLPLTIAANYPAVTDVEVEIAENGSEQVSASWAAPVDKDVTIMSHAKENGFGRGVHGNSSTSYAFMAASEYLPSKLRGYDGYRISAFRFYPMSDALFTFMLYENGKLICELEAENLEFKKWNTCYLPEELYLNENSEYRLVIDCFDPEPEVDVLAVDKELPLEYVSDLLSTDNGETWVSFSIESGGVGSWMMGMLLEDSAGETIAVDGYDVAIDDKVVNSEKVTETSFAYNMTGTGTHSLRVNTWYPGVETSVKGEATTFTLGLSAIKGIGADSDIRLVKGVNYLKVEGEGVQAITIYNSAGAVSAKAVGDIVDITSLPVGVYVVRITTINGVVLRKLIIDSTGF